MLDTDYAENSEVDRRITDTLYGGDAAYRLKQEIVLGIGSVRMLEALGFDIELFHLNEGHSALLALQLLRRSAYALASLRPGESRYDFIGVRKSGHFTTNTPIEAGHDRFDCELVTRVLGEFIDEDSPKRIAGRQELNMTSLALNMSEYVNGVAKRHAETSQQLFPGHRVSALTNGVHPQTWTHHAFATLYDIQIARWRIEPELLMRADCCLPGPELWNAHRQAKTELIDLVKGSCGVALSADQPIIGYARRMTEYKRPDLLFSDLAQLRQIAANRPFQIVLSGKAHPQEESGRRAIQSMHEIAAELRASIDVAFISNCTMNIALSMVAGVDVWLNTPQPPLEASGTSGMKAAMNGVPNLSVLDGWWLEGHIENITGWAIGNSDAVDSMTDADSLYHKFETVVLPLYTDRDAWVALMQSTISRNASMFHSHRMMRRYAAEAYMR